MKSIEVKDKNEKFHNCIAEWDEEENIEEKLTTPISVLEHYKKYTIEEREIIWQKTNHQQPAPQIYPLKGQKMQRKLI